MPLLGYAFEKFTPFAVLGANIEVDVALIHLIKFDNVRVIELFQQKYFVGQKTLISGDGLLVDDFDGECFLRIASQVA